MLEKVLAEGEYNPELEGGHRHPREAVSEIIQDIWGGWGFTFEIDWGILHIYGRNYQVLMKSGRWGKKCSASLCWERE